MVSTEPQYVYVLTIYDDVVEEEKIVGIYTTFEAAATARPLEGWVERTYTKREGDVRHYWHIPGREREYDIEEVRLDTDILE